LGVKRFGRTARVPVAIAPGQPILDASQVAVDLGGRRIVDDVDLAVRAGEVVALVGPNGSGKSTLLSALAGDLPLAGGSVTIDGGALGSWTHTEQAMRRAVLPQHPVVSFPFTVGQIVRMGRAPWIGTEHAAEDDDAIVDALDATDVRQLRTRSYTSLSGGERARVMLSRVLAQRAPLLLLDEPTAALDLHHQEMVLETVRARADAGDAVIVVVHDLGAAGACADRVALMADGRILTCASPTEVLDPQLLSRVYRHEVEVITHPASGELIVLPLRAWTSSTSID
jgi:iron complex transport system ATP-binding protein